MEDIHFNSGFMNDPTIFYSFYSSSHNKLIVTSIVASIVTLKASSLNNTSAKRTCIYLIMNQKRSINNTQEVGLSAKCGCIMYTTIVYWRTIDILVYSISQKLANCT
jgi:hypothetical protein